MHSQFNMYTGTVNMHAMYNNINMKRYNKERRESITLVHMVVAQPCEKYHTFCYSYVRAVKVENGVLYDIG